MQSYIVYGNSAIDKEAVWFGIVKLKTGHQVELNMQVCSRALPLQQNCCLAYAKHLLEREIKLEVAQQQRSIPIIFFRFRQQP
eukprot:302867-Amphidinium_carterae.1